VAALRAARAARVLTSTPRALPVLAAAGVRLDALIGSARDPGEVVASGAIQPAPALEVRTEGGEGGRWTSADGRAGRWRPAPLPGPVADTYGAGDGFAAGLTVGLGALGSLDEALALAARCGAAAVAGRGVEAHPLDPRPDAVSSGPGGGSR
jgi:ribokinase